MSDWEFSPLRKTAKWQFMEAATISNHQKLFYNLLGRFFTSPVKDKFKKIK